MTDLNDLARRCEEGSGGDWELHSEILLALVDTRAPDAQRWYGAGRSFLESLDEAVSFVERALPGCEWGVYTSPRDVGRPFHAFIENPGADLVAYGAESPARALMAAALRALAHKDLSHDE